MLSRMPRVLTPRSALAPEEEAWGGDSTHRLPAFGQTQLVFPHPQSLPPPSICWLAGLSLPAHYSSLNHLDASPHSFPS